MEVTCLSRMRNENLEDTDRGKMTVAAAGRRVGARGGPRVRELVEEGEAHEKE